MKARIQLTSNLKGINLLTLHYRDRKVTLQISDKKFDEISEWEFTE